MNGETLLYAFQTYAFPPNRATTLHGPIPFKKGDCSANTFKDMLPNKHRTALAVCLMNWMSERTTLAGTMLGAPMEEFLMDPDALECYDRFQVKRQLSQDVMILVRIWGKRKR
jgi:hypothetical protein